MRYLTLALLLGVAWPTEAAPSAAATQPATRAVATQRPATTAATNRPAPEVRALVVARNKAVLSSRIAATVNTLSVELGSRFKRGQVLVEFDCRRELADVAIAEAERDRALKVLQSKQELKALKAASDIDVDIAVADHKQAEGNLQKARAEVSGCKVVAPYDGVVVKKAINRYEHAGLGDALLEVVSTSDLQVEALVPSTSIARFPANARFNVLIDETGKQYSAIVDRLVPIVDPVSQTIRIVGHFERTDSLLVPGMSGKVQLP